MLQPFVKRDLKVVVIGGGTGSFTLLSSLKDHTSSIVALVNMADDGGSTGTLRDELGVLPPGDVRQCLVALSRTPEMRDVFSYRFEDGTGLKGHAFGNLFLTALEKMTGDFAKGIELASRVLNIVGSVEPMTLTNIRMAAKLSDDLELKGEHKISESDFAGLKPEIMLEATGGGDVEVNPRAIAAIEQADMVVIAPGNLYSSLAPALVVPGVGEALAKTKAVRVYVANLVTKPGQTDGYDVCDLTSEIERFAGHKFIDAVLFNTEKPSEGLLKKYAKEGELSVEFNTDALEAAPYLAVGVNLLSSQVWQNSSSSDPIASSRTLIRHDPNIVASSLMDLFQYVATANLKQ